MNLTRIADLFKNPDSKSEDSLDTLGILRELSTIVSLSASLTDNKRLARVVTGISVATSLTTVGRHFYTAYKNLGSASEYVVKISETDPVFEIAEKWLNAAMPAEQQRSVYLRTKTSESSSYDNAAEIAVPDGGATNSTGKKPADISLTMQIDGAVAQQVMVAGHTVIISSSNPTDSDEKKKKSFYNARSIIISCPSLDARNAVSDQLELEAQKLAHRVPTFHKSMSWGSFRHISDIPSRPIDSVILKAGQMERMVTFMRRFLDNEESYIKLGIPYRTGMVLFGNPGSGKSSTASAIASELGLNIYYISLSSLDDDDALARAFGEIPAYSLAILEDIDVYSAVQDRKDKDTGQDKGITQAGLLNVLDGFNAPHGVITVMTTNYIDRLDPAIIRPGRVDLMEELNEIDTDQLQRMCKYFIGSVPDGLPEVFVEDGITSAQIVDIIRKFIPNVHDAADDIVSFVKSKALSFTK